MAICSVNDCEKEAKRRGLCHGHYKRLLRFGDANHEVRPWIRGSFEERFWVQVKKKDSGCWEFVGTGPRDDPYGKLLGPDGKYVLAHRASWALHHGSLADEDAVLHRCDNPPCVNPDHLFLGDRADNNRDMAEKGRHFWHTQTRCPNGHEYTDENTLIKDGRRQCRTCRRARFQRGNARRIPSSKETAGE